MTFTGPSPTNFLDRKVSSSFVRFCVTSSSILKALDILSTYLISSPVAPLNREYIEIESPLWYVCVCFNKTSCSTFYSSYIYFSEDIRATMVDLPIYIGSIPLEHIDGFDKKLVESLRRLSQEGIDMDRMAMVIDRDERQVLCSISTRLIQFLFHSQLLSKLESAKGETLSGTLITDFLYGAADGSDLPDALDEIKYYSTLRTWSSKDWTTLLTKLVAHESRRRFLDPDVTLQVLH